MMNSKPAEKTHILLERWAKGDDSALAELFPVYFEKVVGFLTRDGVPREDLEDAVQGAFMKLHVWLKKGNPHPERLTGFLLVSARRIMGERAEKKSLPKAGPNEAARAADDLAASTRSLASSLGSLEMRNRLREAVERLTGRTREIYLLRLDGLSNQEIAQRLGLDPGTVGRYIHDGLEVLKRDFERLARELAEAARKEATTIVSSDDVLQALERIPWVYADPVRCRHFEKLDDAAAAKKLKVTVSVFQARLKQGYDLLEAELGVDLPKAFETWEVSP